MGLTFADIQAMSREADALYPVRLETLFIVLCNLLILSLPSPWTHFLCSQTSLPRRKR